MPIKYKNIPTNIISGFLGAGKTTAIQYLLKHKVATEQWAVIVNEFGQVGIDGELLKNNGVEIKQIPGGCLCCVGSQSLSVGLNQLIRTVKPQRIIIEPTGLGHPAKLISSLTGEFYKNVLDLKAIINLIDARNLRDERYIANESFVDQSNLADILIASKSDQYSEDDKNIFYEYAQSFNPKKLKIAMIEQGCLQLDWLDFDRDKTRTVKFPDSHDHYLNPNEDKVDKGNQNDGWLTVEGHANGFSSIGWRLNSLFVFDKIKLVLFIEQLFLDKSIERVKGVVMTDQGGISVNFTRHEGSIENFPSLKASILEIISVDKLHSKSLDARLKSSLTF